MRKKITVVLVFAALAISGCGKLGSSKYDAEGPVAAGDSLIESSIGDAKNLNPILVSDSAGGDIVGLVFNGLLRYNEKLELEGALAEKWDVSADGKVITYHLRKGVKFHDGVEFTSADVLFTYKVYSDPKTHTPAGADYQDIAEVKALDKYRVRVTYRKAFATALENFSYIVPKHLLEGKDINKDPFDRAPVGTGPYKFVEWKTDQKIVLEANPDYWEGPPHVKRFVMRVIPDQSTELLELLNGGTDALGAWTRGGLTPEQFKRQTDSSKFTRNYHKYKTGDLAYTWIGWNQLRPMFKDKLVRQALTLAIDRQAILENVIYGLGEVVSGPYAPSSWAYNQDVKPMPFDPAKSRELLKAAGWEDTDKDGFLDRDLNGDGKREPFKFTLMTNQGNKNRERIATIVQEQLKAVGIGVEVKITEWTTFLSQFVNKRNYDAIVLGWTGTLDPDCYLIWHSSQTGEHQYNQVNYKNPEVDRLILEGRHTLDHAKRVAIYREIHRLIAEDQPYTFLYNPKSLPAVHKRFKGYEVTNLGVGWHPHQWYVPATLQKYQP